MVVLALWLFVAIVFVYAYRRVPRPLPIPLLVLMVLIALSFAVASLLRGGLLWVRLVMPGLWILAALALTVLARRQPTPRAALTVDLTVSGIGTQEGCEHLRDHLRSLGFSISADAGCESEGIAWTACKRGFEIGRLAFIETYFTIKRFDRLELPQFDQFCRECYSRASGRRRVPVLWRLMFADRLLNYPVAVVSGADPELVRTVTGRRPITRYWRGRGWELPIVLDTADGQMHFSQASTTFPDTRGLTWDILRHEAIRILGG